MFESNDIILLKKLKRRNLLDLALIPPTSYEDTTLSSSIVSGSNLTAKAKVVGSKFHNSKLYIELFLADFMKKATGIFFKTTPYHAKLFSVNSEHIISGRVSYFRGALQISQPKVIQSTGEITPKYKTNLKQNEIRALIKKYITAKSLKRAGLFANEIDAILKLHFPKKMSDVKKSGELREEIVYALKSVEAYNHLMKMRKKRVFNLPIKALRGDERPFIKTLPFELTKDQLKAIKNVKEDLSKEDRAAKRLIIGDVGSGKTMVILAAAMIASKDKSILMAPTSLLANQLYEEASNYLKEFLNIAFITQKKSAGDYKKADFIIGTHALLYKEDLPKVSLIMIDEQHRFGANQRYMLDALAKQDNKSPHFLQFSATPIPRTQAMIESELIDITTIKMLPFKKQITTKIISRDHFSNLIKHIESQIEQKYQILIVYPLVDKSVEVPYMSLNEASDFWQKKFKKVYITHGKDKDKEKILLQFREDGNILLSTTVIEVGISLPRLTTIVIVGAERFGLATLHQLRGRVGRYGIDSHCFLFTNEKTPPKRLEEFSQTLDGFKIAELDLKYRNSGDLLDGVTQSGKAFVWLDLSMDESIISEAKKRVANISTL